MARVEIENIDKNYGAVKILKDISISVKDGEFLVLVGPSGCGKSTLLRMIAGLENISAGEIYIGDRVVNNLPPKERDVSMVFQNYALYPHLTVAENIGFSLILAGTPKAEKERLVHDAADVLGLSDLLERKPKNLSGGQRQRVAMGRAIIRRPKAFLFDEPLSNLDAKLRVAMRAEIKSLHERFKTTAIYVTHDQVEAMTMADRIVVMNEGRIEQIGHPLELYDKPVNAFVAGAFVATAMTGMDQDMMQKNLACRNLKEARLNMGSFSVVLVLVNVLFLALGALLYTWAEANGITIERADSLYPTVALDSGMGIGLGLIFLIGLLASAFSSADSALTALTTSVCVDILGTEKMKPAAAKKQRNIVHIVMTIALFMVIMAFSSANDTSVVAAIFTAANYTYGPILGLFAFGLATSLRPADRFIPVVAILAPIACYGLETYLSTRHGFSFGFALLPVNGLITFLGLGTVALVSGKK